MPSPNILLILMLACFAIPVAFVYFKYTSIAFRRSYQ